MNLAPEILRNTVEKSRNKQLAKLRDMRGQEAQNSVKNFGDRVNLDSVKDPKVTAVEESVLGLLLIFSEYREEVASGREQLTADDFTTEFNRRVFETVMQLHKQESGFHFELLGETFTPAEIGRIRGMEVARQELTENGPQSFRMAVANLRKLKAEKNLKENGNLTDYLQMKRKKLQKGKEDAI